MLHIEHKSIVISDTCTRKTFSIYSLCKPMSPLKLGLNPYPQNKKLKVFHFQNVQPT